MDVKPTDWTDLLSLAKAAKVPIERYASTWSSLERSPTGNRTIFLGPSRCLELVLSRWLEPKVAQALRQGPGPLVIGAQPQELARLIGGQAFSSDLGDETLVIALAADSSLSAQTRELLQTLAPIPQAVFFTPCSAPLTQEDRELLRAVASVVILARVIFVALPSDELTADEMADLNAFGIAQLENAGYRGGRPLSGGVWFAERSAERQGTVGDLAELLMTRDVDLTAGYSWLRRNLAFELLQKIETEAHTIPVLPTMSTEDINSLLAKVEIHLKELERQTSQLVGGHEFSDHVAMQRFVVDSVLSWQHGQSRESVTFDYAESLRPGTKSLLTTAVTESAAQLSIAEKKIPPPPSSVLGELRPIAKAVGLGCLIYYALSWAGSFALAGWVSNLLGVFAATLAGILLARMFAASPPPVKLTSYELKGWQPFVKSVIARVSRHINEAPPRLQPQIAEMRHRLALNDWPATQS